ncbi:MAG: hypothetical protein K8T25_17625 [Planctomycetia bacterium]|nr:hypothetical protein [Planctomycetia bacterium]
MAKIIIDSHEIEIGDRERLNGIQAAARVGVDIRGQLPDVPGRKRPQRSADWQSDDAAEVGPCLPDTRHGRHRVHHR